MTPRARNDDLWPTAPLRSLAALQAAAKGVGLDALARSRLGPKGSRLLRAFWRERVGGLIADELACGFGVHPTSVWPDWTRGAA